MKKIDGKILFAWLTLCLVWSSTWLVIKIGLADLPPISFAAIRFIIAFIVLIFYSLLIKVKVLPKDSREWKLLFLTGIMTFFINYGLVFWGELHVASGITAVLQASISLFGMLFAHYLLPGEPINSRKVFGAIVAISGVTLICARMLEFHGVLSFLGSVGIFIGGVSAALASVLIKRSKVNIAPSVMAAWQMVFGIIPLLAIGILTEGNPLSFHWTLSAWLCLFYLAIVGSALTFVLLYWLLPRISITSLQSISLITPPGAVLLGWLVGGETLSFWFLIGAAFVLLGLWLIFKTPRPVRINKSRTSAI